MADRVELLVVCGPTATGKTRLSIELAKALNGEIVCADSMQIYAGLPIGTAQPTPEEQAEVPHHLTGFLPPEQVFSVAEYQARAQACIAEIAARGRFPILVGGTGLYISSVVKGIHFTDEPADACLRTELETQERRDGLPALYAQLCNEDPGAAQAIHPNNRTRVLRALEAYRKTGKTAAQRAAESLPAQRPYRDVLIGIDFPDREALYERINRRVDIMLQDGLLDEAHMVYEHRTQYRTAAQAIGYKEYFPYFAQQCALQECTDKLKQATRNYAKRQRTWFLHTDGMHWIDAGAPDAVQKALSVWRDGEHGA